jgi:2-oxo-4-hydroxy-4-carboxy--5-ureidoimidazoline (OHCU) decarboxylase
MTEQEERDLAQRLADDSNVFDFDRALELVRRRPAEAEKLLQMQEETEKLQKERARAREGLRLALREEFG